MKGVSSESYLLKNSVLSWAEQICHAELFKLREEVVLLSEIRVSREREIL